MLHKEKFGHVEGKLKENKFNVLKSDLQRQQKVFTIASKSSEAMAYASLTLLQRTAKHSK
jgi:hypothetical protein